MAEPTPATDGAPVPPDDTENGRAKHVAPTTGETVDRPAPARAATGPDAAPQPAVADRPAATGAEPVSRREEVAPAQEDVAPAHPEAAPAAAASGGSDAQETREEPAVPAADRTAVLPENRDEVGTDGAPAGAAAPADADRTAVLPADREEASAGRTPPPPPAPEQRTAPLPPADEPAPPRRSSNRLVGTAWVLLAALIFEVVYLAAFALVVIVVAGPATVGLSLQQLAGTPFAWLPVVLFALFYELTVLLLNRAGRFAYVLASLIVALIVYVLSAVLILAMQQGGIGNEANLGRALIAPQVVLIPIVAREVMLWTGLAIGARGHRVRRRDRAAAEQYERERFARSVQGPDDRVGDTA